MNISDACLTACFSTCSHLSIKWCGQWQQFKSAVAVAFAAPLPSITTWSFAPYPLMGAVVHTHITTSTHSHILRAKLLPAALREMMLLLRGGSCSDIILRLLLMSLTSVLSANRMKIEVCSRGRC